jgi:hypothetical protein
MCVYTCVKFIQRSDDSLTKGFQTATTAAHFAWMTLAKIIAKMLLKVRRISYYFV